MPDGVEEADVVSEFDCDIVTVGVFAGVIVALCVFDSDWESVEIGRAHV